MILPGSEMQTGGLEGTTPKRGCEECMFWRLAHLGVLLSLVCDFSCLHFFHLENGTKETTLQEYC